MKHRLTIAGVLVATAFAIAAFSLAIPPDAFAAAVATAPPAATPEAAQGGSIVNIPWGAYASELIIAAGGVATWLIGRGVGLLPGPAKWAIELTKINQVANKAIEVAAFDLAAKIAKEGYSVNVRNEMLAKSLNAFQANAQKLYKQFQATLELKLKARIEAYIAEKVAEAG